MKQKQIIKLILIIVLITPLLLSANKVDSFKILFFKTDDKQLQTKYGMELMKLTYRKNIDTGIAWGEAARIYAKALDDTSKFARVSLSLGNLYKMNKDYSKALFHFLIAQKTYKQLNDHHNYALCSRSLAVLYYQLEDYINSQIHYHKALDGFSEVNDEYEKAGVLVNIGIIQMITKDFQSAKQNFNNSIRIYTKLNKTVKNAKILLNLGYVYMEEDSLDKALEIQFRAFKYLDKEKQIETYADLLNNIGIIHFKNKSYSQAKEFLSRSLSIGENIDNDKFKIINTIDLAKVYCEQNDFVSAEKYLNKIRHNKFFLEHNVYKMKAYKLFSRIYESKSDFKKAHKYNLMHLLAKDSIENATMTKTLLKNQMNFEFSKKMELEKKERALQEERLRSQKIINWSLMIGVLLMIGIAGFIFKIYRDQLNARRTISEQKNELQHLHDEQTSSIRYAKKIQEAVLPSKNNLSKYLPDHFVFYLPRDIVSGDFYWAHKTPDGHSIFAVADCTGHGVPGAFMSMIGHSLLNEIIITRGITDPARALNDMRTMIISSLHQKGEEGEARDGMDIALCILSPDNKTLSYSGAFNSLYIIRGGELMETKADPQPIGFYADDMDFFTNHEIELHKNDCIYIFSDGYPDQFGGPKGKKYMYKPFKAMLKKIHIQPMDLQADLLRNEFKRWRGEEPQIDDVCILGVKV